MHLEDGHHVLTQRGIHRIHRKGCRSEGFTGFTGRAVAARDSQDPYEGLPQRGIHRMHRKGCRSDSMIYGAIIRHL